jgi:hypothetical protein
MTDQREVILVYIGIVLQIGGAAAALYVSSALPLTSANLGLLVLAALVIGLGRFMLRRFERVPEPYVVHRGPAAYGEPTEPGMCPLCKERPGTIYVRNFVAVPAAQIPNPRPDVWICPSCADTWVYKRVKAPGDVGS